MMIITVVSSYLTDNRKTHYLKCPTLGAKKQIKFKISKVWISELVFPSRVSFFRSCTKKSITLLLPLGFDLCEGQRALNWSRVRLRSIASLPTPPSPFRTHLPPFRWGSEPLGCHSD